MQVTIDGIQYAPVSISRSAIGIAITTHNRPEVLKRAIEQHLKHLPSGALVVVIDDGSNPPAVVPHVVKLVRHDQSRGIVASKNACLTELVDAGCEHLFLWDDDAWPIADNWHLPYIESPEPHLAYQFKDLATGPKMNDFGLLYRDDKHVAYTGQRGVMLYYHITAIEKVGGFDNIYGRGMYEHGDLALRIHNAGMTTWAFADVVGSEKLIHSLDEHCAVKRSIPPSDRNDLAAKNEKIFSARRDSGYCGYAEYRKTENVVITSLITAQVDPQRGARMKADASALQKWSNSIQGVKKVILADELTKAPDGAELVSVPDAGITPYFSRWLHLFQYLRANKHYNFVWSTDGTDVEMLRSPWDEMEPGKIYVGSEHATYSLKWMRDNHHGRFYTDFLNKHANEPLLNSGLLGGRREDVMAFVHRMIRLYFWIESHRFWGTEKAPSTVVEMGAFGVAAKEFGDRIVTGPKVHTIFKSDGIGKGSAWWKHK
ncbi:glycosyltransferase [Citrobacter sp. Cb223]|uniref:glycosyltransferase family 2 protein n=1 Tax=Citrobacter sp. Cb223 TaxID=2985035 RepID=UPI002574E8BF|nr:glycosyltransferase [Citrobacter sp. Cb223]MDM3311197.1 glycosyltransferase [Citrobacter sp. Cb223]